MLSKLSCSLLDEGTETSGSREGAMRKDLLRSEDSVPKTRIKKVLRRPDYGSNKIQPIGVSEQRTLNQCFIESRVSLVADEDAKIDESLESGEVKQDETERKSARSIEEDPDFQKMLRLSLYWNAWSLHPE